MNELDPTPSEYFPAVISFLNEFRWIYQHSNTTFIKHRVKDDFPPGWIEYFSNTSNENLNNFPSNSVNDTPPESLKAFLETVQALKIPKNENFFTGKEVYFKKMNPKKVHEISSLSETIERIFKDEVDVLIDFGSGLGYLSEILHKRRNYKILGLECDEQRVQAAVQRQERMYAESKGNIVYKSHWIDEASDEFIEQAISDLNAEHSKLAIVGLHSCADLTVTSMKLFLKMEKVQKLAIMPCCHHKMAQSESGVFRNFPLSRAFQSACEKSGCAIEDVFNRPFLRLACQQTAARWKTMTEEEHFEHGRDMFLRGLVESALEEDEVVAKLKSNKKCGEISVEELQKSYELKCKITNLKKEWRDCHAHRFKERCSEYSNGVRFAEALTCLQATIQEICEDVVLFDRICFMREQAAERNIRILAKVEKIMDERLSPRCFVLIAEKI